MALKIQISTNNNFKIFEAFKKNLKDIEKMVARVGVLGEKNARDDGLTNGEVGMAHEFGSTTHNIPKRSFLKDPIEIKQKDLTANTAKIIKRNIAKQDSSNAILEEVGVSGVAIVQEAFSTKGFGTWPALSNQTIKDKKGKDSPLIDTSELRKSIMNDVVDV